uniref:Pentapeptide repeat-containing protein n=1 Tax=Candidatus Kentrum sp. TUN TaxID=2126343 RepID=A0A450ZJN1_9GAMM|nr:MAG: Pentapeptide repeat-containing protein [Candidatus Kentron sp. TUN]VFK54023.1 MAG: Pentapeptide repeat-containing protein [Candidatus Kentron sp. TUN]
MAPNGTVQGAQKIAQLKAQQHAYSFEIPLTLIRNAIVGFLKKDRGLSTKIKIHGVHLDYADFTKADLNDYDFTGATLTHVNFKRATLTDTIFDRAVILNSYFSENDIGGTSFKKAILGSCHFHDLSNKENKNGKPSPNKMDEALLVVSC